MTALATCNVGGIDKNHQWPFQGAGVDHYYFDEINLPFPLPNLNNRLKGKYIKIETHRFLDSDIICWIDGSIEILSPNYVQTQLELLGDADLLVCIHPARPSPTQELKFILDKIALGGSDPHSRYLIDRYGDQPIQEELDFISDYQTKIGHELPLYAGGIFTRRNSEKVNKAFDEWFLLCLEFANFDQCMFSYIIHKHGLKVATQDYHSDLRKFHNHLF